MAGLRSGERLREGRHRTDATRGEVGHERRTTELACEVRREGSSVCMVGATDLWGKSAGMGGDVAKDVASVWTGLKVACCALGVGAVLGVCSTLGTWCRK